ncbi:MAG TPA: transglycosylase domain-containing protein [Candidatus Dormibacteraeota bacterium]|nr:transglycosylase domain-containing protein [Candidatus Dormibacteraeota bacterium]
MHPAMQRRRHRLMVRRTTRRHAPRRGIATAVLVLLGVLVLFVVGSVAGTAGGLLAAYNYYATGLPDPHLLDEIELPASTYVYDRTGQTLLARFECQNREQVRFDELPPYIVDAAIAAEDRTFWTNDGIDYYAVGRAALANLEAGGIVQGASTITAQVIKYAGSIQEAQAANQPESTAAPSVELDPEAEPEVPPEIDVCAAPALTFLSGRGFDDKIREFILARQMTAAYPGRQGKEKILETYLNLIFYGNGSYGIKAAAANYFGIADLNQLTLAQAAFLAGLPRLPSAYDPYYLDQGPERAIARRNLVLDAMLRDGYITVFQHDEAAATTWEQMGPNRITSVLKEPHFSFRVRREAERILEAQGVANPEQAVRTGGYRITTTLDFNLQQAAKQQVVKWVNALADKNVHNGALVAINSATGEIVAYVGSVDYYNREDPRVQGQFDVAGLGVRQPGSAFKPITYTSAFRARQATVSTFFVDAVTQFGTNRATSYMPTNADIRDHGPLLATDALRYSLNVPSVMMQHLVGPPVTAELAESMGIASAQYINELEPGLTLALGSVPVNLVNFTGAYGVFAAQGTLHPATTILEIRDRDNRIVYSIDDNGPETTTPITPAEAYLTHWILEGNTDPRRNVLWGSRAQLTDAGGNRRHAGFKTGTTNDFRDVSGFGYVPGSLVTGVWMGNNNQEPLSNRLGQGLFSADGPLHLWHDFMEIALNQPWDWNGKQPVPQTDFPQPNGVVTANVCRFSGMAATGNCGPTQQMPFLDGTVPPPDNLHSKGCFDIEQAIRQDSRRPAEWVAAAHLWADRFVNRNWGAVGDPTKLKENANYRLSIAPVLGNNGFGAPICGQVRATPKPRPTPDNSDPPGTCPPGNQKRCSPSPAETPPAPAGELGAPIDGGVLTPIFGVSTLLGLLSLSAPWLRRAGRRRPSDGGAWENRERVDTGTDPDPGRR